MVIDNQFALEKIHAVEMDVQRRMLNIKQHYIEFSESKQQCLEQAFKHLAGMFCAWCDPKWENWLLKQSDGTYELNMNEQVCHKLSEECYGYLENLEKSNEIAVEVHKLNSFLNQQTEIKAAIEENDFLTVERAYAKSQELTQEEASTILDKQMFKMPETCTKEDCPYICDEFITPNGINIDEMLENAQTGKKGDTGFLSMISEDLKVKFSKSTESISPEAIATGLDTNVVQEEVLMTTDEQKLLEQEPITMMIDTINNDVVEEENVEEEETVEEQVTDIEEEAE